jgi:hypothetical protein
MKLIIDIPDEVYASAKNGELNEIQSMYICGSVCNGIPYEERSQGEFTDLERKVTADAINYLLGAELLEENGYTEAVTNALKSALQKIGAEENHL